MFLSFRGKDTRKGFIDFPYNKLTYAGFHVSRDNDAFPYGGATKQTKRRSGETKG
ncbi:uncharacterized protein J3R85_003615 [Psidium guajava]|nr:uncharacterized protein J3R85_003615 [Psidium guajava]